MNKPTILEQFKGFLDTPDIFKNTASSKVPVFEFPEIKLSPGLISDLKSLDHPRNSVLGKRMESFFELAIKHSNRYQIIASNLQVIQNKKTIGEIDFLLRDLQNSKILHVELVYKLYVFDDTFSSDMAKWIGPNRKDSLPEKMEKLQVKQFPLLYREETKKYLKTLEIDPRQIEQQLCFKAQLFYPENPNHAASSIVNPECFRGKWINLKEFQKLDESNFRFFLPKKKFWSSSVDSNLEWLDRNEILEECLKLLDVKKSPLIWFRNANRYGAFFLVWW